MKIDMYLPCPQPELVLGVKPDTEISNLRKKRKKEPSIRFICLSHFEKLIKLNHSFMFLVCSLFWTVFHKRFETQDAWSRNSKSIMVEVGWWHSDAMVQDSARHQFGLLKRNKIPIKAQETKKNRFETQDSGAVAQWRGNKVVQGSAWSQRGWFKWKKILNKAQEKDEDTSVWDGGGETLARRGGKWMKQILIWQLKCVQWGPGCC